jgi:conjugal transfer mating pair stabilization protein TraG
MFEIYAYGNVDTLNGVFNAIAAIMGGGDYFGLIKTVAVTGVLVAAFSGLFTPGRFHGWGWLFGFLFLYHVLFLPKADVVVVDKLGSQPPVVIGNVPLGVAFFGHITSKVGDVMTRFFETAFQVIPAPGAQLPSELAYQKNGVMFGNRVIQSSRNVNVADPQLRTDLIAFVYNCTLYDLQDGTIDPAAFGQSTDIWTLMGNPNPARFSTFGNPVQIDTCPKVYAYLANRLPAEVARARAVLAFQLNPSLDPAAAQGVIDSQVEQAYYKTKIATAAQSAADLLRQNIMLNLVQDTSSIVGQKINDPASVMIATARANATASINSSFLTMGRVAEQALPLIRNVIEAIVYAVFPFVFLLFLLAHGRGLGLAIKSFVLSLVWIQLWPPLYAILNYVATLASARTLEAAAKMGAGAQGLALETASSIYYGAISDQAVAGYMVISIPIIATAIIKGGEVAFQAVTGVGTMQSTVSGEANAATKGNVTQDAVSFDQQQLAPNRTSAYMATSADAHGTTIQGTGPDAGVFRYQATLSRLATTFTISERQASALADTAREAETFATSERESMQRSQAAALTQALSMQDSFERSHTRSGARLTSDGGTTSTQLQTLSSIAREVNRRLGLSEESSVGNTVAATAAAGLKIPLTEIGGRIAAEGRHADQERLQGAYDYARKAAESAQISDATALMKEFRTSEAYQWSRGNRTAGSESFDSAYREALDRQSSSELAHARAKETGRIAQFMREWSSGAQTDFTNYAARRLAERGLLREEDPIKLQRAVTEIAYSYARGGHVGPTFIPKDTPLEPTRAPAQLLGWSGTTLRQEYEQSSAHSSTAAVTNQVASNDAAVRDRQAQHGVQTSQRTSDDLALPVRERAQSATAVIEHRRGEIASEQGQVSRDYNRTVNAGTISSNHGGNKAVWDTVGAQTDNRAELGTPPAATAFDPAADKSVPDSPGFPQTSEGPAKR